VILDSVVLLIANEHDNNQIESLLKFRDYERDIAMNYVIAAYEQGFHQLLERMGKDHPKYATVLLLQAGLQKNFNETRYSDDGEKRSFRIDMIAHLNDLTRQVIDISFTYGRRGDCSLRRQSRTVRESFPSYGSSVYGHCD